MGIKEFFTGYKGKDMPKELKEFNWAAFLLTFIWGIKYKAWITLLAIPLIWFQLPMGLNWILFIILQFYCGFKGNEWAYQEEWWKKPYDFRITQMKWAAFAISINVIIPLIGLFIAARFAAKSADDPTELVNNIQCSMSYKNLKKGLPKIPLTSSMNSVDIALEFSKHFKNSKQKGNTVIFSLKNGKDYFDAYELIFEKSYDEICDIKQRNCSVTSRYLLPEGFEGLGKTCIFYFDNSKHVVPDSRTQKAVDKGFNIFKYL